MNILDLLTHEHEELRRAMNTLASPDSRSREVRRFAHDLERHAQFEDVLLFVELEGKLPTDHGPLPVMRAEHVEIEEGLARLESLVDTDPDWRPLLVRLLEVTRGHFAKEERVLFPFASHQVAPSRLETLGQQLAEARRLTETPAP